MGFYDEMKKSRPKQHPLRGPISLIYIPLVIVMHTYEDFASDVEFTKKYFQKNSSSVSSKNEKLTNSQQLKLDVEELKKTFQKSIQEEEKSSTEFITEEKSYHDLLKDFRTTIQITNDKKENIHLNYAMEYFKEGKLKLSLEHLQEALSITPTNYFALFLSSMIHQRLGNAEESIKLSKKSISNYEIEIGLEKYKPKRERLKNYYNLSLEQKKDHFWNKITLQEKKYERLMPRDELLKYHLSLLFYSNYFSEGIEFIESEEKFLKENEGFYNFQKGNYYYINRNFEKSIPFFLESLKLLYEVDKCKKMLFMCYKRKKDEKNLEAFKNEKNIEFQFPECDLYTLPPELIELLIHFMDNNSLIAFSSTCRDYRNGIASSKFNRIFQLSELQYDFTTKKVLEDISFTEFVKNIQRIFNEFPFQNEFLSLNIGRSNILHHLLLIYEGYPIGITKIVIIPDDMEKDKVESLNNESFWFMYRSEFLMNLLNETVIDDITWDSNLKEK
eukprot:gene6561-10724_t